MSDIDWVKIRDYLRIRAEQAYPPAMQVVLRELAAALSAGITEEK